MTELIENYENQLQIVETRITELVSKLDDASGTRDRDSIRARIAVLETEYAELIDHIHEMKSR